MHALSARAEHELSRRGQVRLHLKCWHLVPHAKCLTGGTMPTASNSLCIWLWEAVAMVLGREDAVSMVPDGQDPYHPAATDALSKTFSTYRTTPRSSHTTRPHSAHPSSAHSRTTSKHARTTTKTQPRPMSARVHQSSRHTPRKILHANKAPATPRPQRVSSARPSSVKTTENPWRRLENAKVQRPASARPSSSEIRARSNSH